jgi:NAD(P)-dependent dehydrogenase (short-subunit alcohol dehydrogenase family)
VKHLFAKILGTFGRLDIVVTNAGAYGLTPLHSITVEDLRYHLDTDLFGVIQTI